MTRTLVQLKEEFLQDGILMCFNGSFTQDIIIELGNAVKQYLGREEIAQASLMDVFSIFIEQMQNVRNYTSRIPLYDQDPLMLQSAIVMIGKQQDKYWIQSGNYIANEDLSPLTTKLDYLNSLDKSELRKLYKSKLREELPPDAKSAGLGLIDIARRMSEPFNYEMHPVDSKFSFYSLRVTI